MEERFDIAYIISHGFAARMVMQTDLLGKLADSGKKVAIITPDRNDPGLLQYSNRRNIHLVEFNEKNGFFNENYMFKRKYFLEDLKANPALWEKHIHAVRYNTSLHPLRRIRPLYYGLIYFLIPFFPFIRKSFVKNEKKYLKSENAEKLLYRLRPCKLVSTYPVNYNEAVLLHYGNKHPEIETWIHLLSWDNITCKGRFPELADKYISWGPIMTEELMSFYNIESSKIFECGVPHFDLHLEVNKNPNYKPFIEKLNLDPDKPYLFFAMSSPRFAPHEIDIVEWLAENILKKTFGDLQLVIRPHPQNITGNMKDKSWIERLKVLDNMPGVAVDFPELNESKLAWSMKEGDMYRLANLITGSSIVLNSGSTISIDALMHLKPVIVTSFDGTFKLNYWKSARRLIDYEHLKRIVEMRGVVIVTCFDEMVKEINNYLNNENINYETRQFTINREVKLDRCSATSLIVNLYLNSIYKKD